LSILQHGAYTLLIDACYDREQFPSLDDAMDWLLPIDNEEKDAIEFVLKRFFTLNEGVYVQNRIKEEIDAYHEKAIKNKEIALNRELAKKNKARNVNETCKEREPNQEPRTINQEPRTINQLKDDFDKFYSEYPKHVGEKVAKKAWLKIKEKDKLIIFDAIANQKLNNPQWVDGDKKFIKAPAVWLNQECWKDEFEPIRTKNSNSAINQSSNAAMNLINGTGEDYAGIR